MLNATFERHFSLYYVEPKPMTHYKYSVTRLTKPECIEVSPRTIRITGREYSGLFEAELYSNTHGIFVLVLETGTKWLSRFFSLRLKSVDLSLDESDHVKYDISFDILDNEPEIVKAVQNHMLRTSYAKYFNSCFNAAVTEVSIENMNKEYLVNNSQFAFAHNSQFGLISAPRCNNKTNRLFSCLPRITTIYYNDPHTAVKWDDGTTTVVGCAEGEDFSKELGLAVAIAKKYYESLGFMYPRAALKHAADRGVDQSAKTKARKKYKQDKKNSEKQE